MSEQENIKFVEAVQKFPCLYDYTLRDYSRKDVTENSWNEVGKMTNLTASQSKDKWKNLRTVLSRHLKAAPSGSTFKRKKPYYLSDAMSFAIPFIKTHSSSTASNSAANKTDNPAVYCEENDDNSQENMTIEYYEQSTSPASLESVTLPQPSYQASLPVTSHHSETYQPHPSVQYMQTPSSLQAGASQPKKVKKNRDLSEIDECFLEYLINRKTENDNPIQTSRKMFMLSLLPDIYSLSDTQMRAFKFKVLTLIEELMQMPNAPSTQSTSVHQFTIKVEETSD